MIRSAVAGPGRAVGVRAPRGPPARGRTSASGAGTWPDGPLRRPASRAAGLGADAELGRTFSTELLVAADGRLVVSSCGAQACRVRVLDPATGRVDRVTRHRPGARRDRRQRRGPRGVCRVPVPGDGRRPRHGPADDAGPGRLGGHAGRAGGTGSSTRRPAAASGRWRSRRAGGPGRSRPVASRCAAARPRRPGPRHRAAPSPSRPTGGRTDAIACLRPGARLATELAEAAR